MDLRVYGETETERSREIERLTEGERGRGKRWKVYKNTEKERE